MTLHKFEAKPTLENNGIVTWELCYTTPSPKVCGTEGNFPSVTLDVNKLNEPFQFKIVDDQTGLNIKFADADPLWIHSKSQPKGPGVDTQIHTLEGGGKKTLTFKDTNSLPNPGNPQPLTLKYQLNFTDGAGNKVSPLDPDIKNGGTNVPFEPKVWHHDLLGGIGDGISLLIGLAAGALIFRLLRR